MPNTFSVTDNSTSTSKTYTSKLNLKIENYKEGTTDKKDTGTVIANIYPNKKTNSIYVTDSKSTTTSSTLGLSSTTSKVFEAFASLDGNATDVSLEDVKKAKTLDKNKYGLKDIRVDVKAGIATLVMKTGWVLRFDFETAEDKQQKN